MLVSNRQKQLARLLGLLLPLLLAASSSRPAHAGFLANLMSLVGARSDQPHLPAPNARSPKDWLESYLATPVGPGNQLGRPARGGPEGNMGRLVQLLGRLRRTGERPEVVDGLERVVALRGLPTGQLCDLHGLAVLLEASKFIGLRVASGRSTISSQPLEELLMHYATQQARVCERKYAGAYQLEQPELGDRFQRYAKPLLPVLDRHLTRAGLIDDLAKMVGALREQEPTPDKELKRLIKDWDGSASQKQLKREGNLLGEGLKAHCQLYMDETKAILLPAWHSLQLWASLPADPRPHLDYYRALVRFRLCRNLVDRYNQSDP